MMNTLFVVATHSSPVIAQCDEGEVYRLVRDGDGVVRRRACSTCWHDLDVTFHIATALHHGLDPSTLDQGMQRIFERERGGTVP